MAILFGGKKNMFWRWHAIKTKHNKRHSTCPQNDIRLTGVSRDAHILHLEMLPACDMIPHTADFHKAPPLAGKGSKTERPGAWVKDETGLGIKLFKAQGKSSSLFTQRNVLVLGLLVEMRWKEAQAAKLKVFQSVPVFVDPPGSYLAS